jgi:drug/metabolite transporter (DMT)-like permease
MKWLLLFLMITATVASDVLQSREMKLSGAQSISAPGLVRLLQLILARRLLLLAIACMAVSFFSFMALVQTEPLSFAVPASAASFIFETLLAKFALKEKINSRRAIGTVIVMLGVILLGD